MIASFGRTGLRISPTITHIVRAAPLTSIGQSGPLHFLPMTDTPANEAAPNSGTDSEKKLPAIKREPLSPATVEQLRYHAERTGVGAMRLLRGAKDKPAGLKSDMVGRWMTGKLREAAPDHVAYILARWATLPTNNRIPLTAEMRAQLRAEFRRTGSGPVLLMKRAPDIPPGLTHQIIQDWVSNRPKPHTASETHWNYVSGRLGAMPDYVVAPVRFVETLHQRKIEITADEFAELHHHRQRTGIGGAILLRGASDKPEGLTPGMVSGWLNRHATRAAPGFVAYVLARYRAWP